MIRIFSTLFVLVLLTGSCDFKEKVKSFAKSDTVEETNPQEGKDEVKKFFYSDGTLKTVVNYKKGVKAGTTLTYYPTGEKQYEIPYKDGLKDGIVKWFYKDGQLYRETSYVRGKRNGDLKLYWGNGKLKAHAHYKNGMPGVGLKEYSNKGIQRKEPHIVVQSIDHLSTANEYILKFRLSDGSKKVEFYLGELEAGGFFPETLSAKLAWLKSKSGEGVLSLHLPEGNYIRKTLHIVAVKTTPYKNKLIIERDYPISLINDPT